MDQVVLDLETKKGFSEVGGRDRLGELGVSVVGLFQYQNETYRCFEEGEFSKLEQILSEASRVIGFNTLRFDFPVLQPWLKNLKLSELRSLDLLDEIEKAVGHRVSLQSLSQATLGIGKSGTGLDALRFYQSGDMESLKKYCLDDVRITKDVYEFGKKFGKVYFTSRDGTGRVEVPVIWKDPDPAPNLSLFQ